MSLLPDVRSGPGARAVSLARLAPLVAAAILAAPWALRGQAWVPSPHPLAEGGAGEAAAGVLGQEACPAAGPLVGDLTGALAHVRYLADDALEGREVGTRGERCAADYLAARFRVLGLQPAGPEAGLFQVFPVRSGAVLGSANALEGPDRSYTPGDEWIPFGFSAAERVRAPLAYLGHGVSRPGDGTSPWAGDGVGGRIVVVEDGDPASPSGRSLQGDPHFKASLAAGRGARGMLVLLPDGAPLPDPASEVRGSPGIPAAAVRGAAARALREAARTGREALLSADVRPRIVEARNVAALLEGADPELSGQVVVVGAHYDHLGLGGPGSLAPHSRGEVHNGADDNASGTAALLEVAGRLAGSARRPARSVLFLAFTGEERGLWGSAHYVENPLVPLGRTVAMLNMDMVGRLEDRALTVFGVGTAREWPDLVEEASASLPTPVPLATAPDGFGPSDHSSFYGKGIPVLHFFTNTHRDYHRPSDEWQRIDAAGLEAVVDLVTEVVLRLAGTPGARAVALTPVTAVGHPHAAPAPASGDPAARSGGYGPYLGTIPDMTPGDGGVRLTGVREGSPADEAGIRAGDVIVSFGGREIGDLYALTYALQDSSPGDRVEIGVLRDGRRLSVTAVLADRR